MSQASSLRAVLYALGANSGILIAKGTAAAITGSSAMLAEAIHSAADCGNQVLLLFTMGGLFSIYEGWHKLQDSEPMSNAGIAIGVLVVAIVLEAFSLAGCIREIRKVSGDRTLWRYFRTSRNSELIVVLGEDIAALAGLAIALIAIVVAVVTGNPVYDALGSMAVGVLLVIVAVLLAIEIKAMIIGESTEAETEAAIHRFLSTRPEVAEIYNVVSLQLGDSVMLAIKARMKETGSAIALIDAINIVEADLRTAFPVVQWSFFEPDNKK